jgi:hypothetical protein
MKATIATRMYFTADDMGDMMPQRRWKPKGVVIGDW